ncbi:serine protease family protein [Pseudomonas massiliensis]|uniref:serine protease n=1 Tax=Pseudomonas massiliensis TaxID=522492 RepID=UPI0011DC9319|nr:serine protease [Pseudomonas massiliensis]
MSFKSLLVACVLLSGCNGMPAAYLQDPVHDQAFVVHSSGPLPLMLMGSAVQWNEDYAVTVKHVPYLSGSVHQGKGDVQFFRRKAEKAPQWRQFVPGEVLTAVGFNSLYVPIKGQGRALAAMVRLDARDNVLYGTHDGPTAKGMSGGPVFAADGNAVGINVAYLTRGDLQALKRKDLADQPRVSIFMPYSEIAREWRRFEAQQALSATTRLAKAD